MTDSPPLGPVHQPRATRAGAHDDDHHPCRHDRTSPAHFSETEQHPPAQREPPGPTAASRSALRPILDPHASPAFTLTASEKTKTRTTTRHSPLDRPRSFRNDNKEASGTPRTRFASACYLLRLIVLEPDPGHPVMCGVSTTGVVDQGVGSPKSCSPSLWPSRNTKRCRSWCRSFATAHTSGTRSGRARHPGSSGSECRCPPRTQRLG
jgi:hypothetical protein